MGASLIASGAVGLGLARWGGLRRGGGKRRAGEGIGRDVSGLPASVWFASGAIVFLSVIVGAGLAGTLPASLTGGRGSDAFKIAAAVCGFGMGAIVGLTLLYAFAARVGEECGFGWRWKDVPIGLLGIACVAPFYVFATSVSQWVAREWAGAPAPELAHASLEVFVRAPWSPTGLTIGITAVVLAPIVEECVYRVFLTSCLMRLATRGGGARPGGGVVVVCVVAVSLLFAWQHTGEGGPAPWVAVPGLFVLAVGLGVAYERTRRVAVPMIMHAVFNLANLGLALLTHAH